MQKSKLRFISKKDMTITPLVEAVLIAIAVLATALISMSIYPLRTLEFIALSYLNLMALTLIVLKLIRICFPFKEGIFTDANHNQQIYIWNLYGFLCITNLSLFYQNNLLPIPFRKFFLQLLGTKIGSGVFAIAGMITDPHMVEIEENVILGNECYISPHAIISISGGDALLVKKIVLKKNCIIGARAMLQPGVIVGAGSTIAPNAVVPMNTIVPDGINWPPKTN